jgi:hypothetical protein
VTLAAHGIIATMAVSSVYPSVDFVEGVGVMVRLEDELRARRIIETLGLDKTSLPEDSPTADGG